MQTCYNHPKLQAVAHCRRCKLPTCCHCVEDLYCPDCIKLQRYLALGRTSDRRPQLVETPKRRSMTMELMIQRLQRQAFDADAASLNPPRRPTARKIKAGVKTKQGLSYGLLMPGIAPLVKVSRSPISRFAALALVAFSLGAFFSQTRTTYAEPAPVAQAEVEQEFVEPAPAPVEVRTHYKPVYIYVNTPQAAPATYRVPTPAPTVMPRAMIGYAPAVAPVQTAAKPAAAPIQSPAKAAAPAAAPVEAEPELDEALAGMRSPVEELPEPSSETSGN